MVEKLCTISTFFFIPDLLICFNNNNNMSLKVKEKVFKHKQEHLFRFYDKLSEEQKIQYTKSLEEINFQEMTHLFEKALKNAKSDIKKLDDLMQPISAGHIECEESCSKEKLNKYLERGLTEIANGRVGVILMAGGQGSRLGVTYPKGMYDVGLLSKKTLFQLQAERILKVEKLAYELCGKRGNVVWYIMTSGPTVTETKEFLSDNNYFGLNQENVIIFEQGLLPCFDYEGKIFMNGIDELSVAPDGNGGIYKALLLNGILDHFKSRGIRYLHCHSVDNILVKVADPVFLGYCIERGADCGAKVVQKNSPTECVGVLCNVEGKVQVVEYCEISESTAKKTNADGTLTYNAGNICNHFFTADFLREVSVADMPLHVANKKIPYLNESGALVRPTKPNGIKIEKFVFDAFQFSKHFVAWEVPRHSEFSALKNTDDVGKDCPSTAKQDLYRLHRYYLKKVDAAVIGDEVEISPSLSYAGEGLEKYRGITITSPTLL